MRISGRDMGNSKVKYPRRVSGGAGTPEPVYTPNDSVVDTGQVAVLGHSIDAIDATEGSPLGNLLMSSLDAVEALGGKWHSSVIRGEAPMSAAAHFVLGGKAYMLILQPVDMPDRGTVRP